jgi:hypothetical protein
MNVVLVSVHCFDDDIGMMLRPRFEKLLQVALNPIVEDFASVFGRPDEMVRQSGSFADTWPFVQYSLPNWIGGGQ